MRTFSFLLACCVVGPSMLWGQAPAEPMPVIRSETRLVLVDTVVTDKQGRYIRDLERKDFRLWEDGKQQTITSLSYASDAASPWHSEGQYIALFFDDSSVATSDQLNARNDMAKWLDANAGNGTAFAVFDYRLDLRLTQNFTENPILLKAAVVSARSGRAQPREGAPQAFASLGPGRRLLLSLRSVAQVLANVPGRKILVFVSSGFGAEQDEIYDAIRALNRANVAVYPLDPSGQRETGMMQMQSRASEYAGFDGQNNQVSRRDALMTMAQRTGGFFTLNANDLLGGLTKIGSERNEYYLLGYPAPESATGSCHDIRVKVERPGVNLRARSSYCNGSFQDQLAGTQTANDLERRAVSEGQGKLTAELKLPYFYTGANAVRVNVTLDIPRSALEFQKQKGKLRSVVNVLGVAYAADGKAAARFSDQIVIEAEKKSEVEALSAESLHYENQFQIMPGEYKFKLVFAPNGETFGKLELPLSIEAFDGKQLTMSGVALSKETHRVEDGAAAPLDGRTSMVVSGMRMIPTATDRFKSTDKVTAYIEAFDPVVAASDPQGDGFRLRPGHGFRLRIVEGATGAQRVDSGWLPWNTQGAPSPIVPIGFKVKLDSLTPGPYRLEVQVANTAGAKSNVRKADFEIE